MLVFSKEFLGSEYCGKKECENPYTESLPTLLFFFTQPQVARPFFSSLLVIHKLVAHHSPLVIHLLIARRSRLHQFTRYLEPCLPCHNGAAGV